MIDPDEDEVLVETGWYYHAHNYCGGLSVPVYVSLPFIGPRTPFRHQQWLLCQQIERDKRRAELWAELIGTPLA